MVKIETIIKAIARYLDAELMVKLSANSYQRVLTGAAISMALKRSENLAKKITESPVLKCLLVVDDAGSVDAKFLCDEIKAQIPESGMVVDVPIVGKMTFHVSDLDTLYRYITEAAELEWSIMEG